MQPLTIGELWAIAITLRIFLIENLRRLADQITAGRSACADADAPSANDRMDDPEVDPIFARLASAGYMHEADLFLV